MQDFAARGRLGTISDNSHHVIGSPFQLHDVLNAGALRIRNGVGLESWFDDRSCSPFGMFGMAYAPSIQRLRGLEGACWFL